MIADFDSGTVGKTPMVGACGTLADDEADEFARLDAIVNVIGQTDQSGQPERVDPLFERYRSALRCRARVERAHEEAHRRERRQTDRYQQHHRNEHFGHRKAAFAARHSRTDEPGLGAST